MQFNNSPSSLKLDRKDLITHTFWWEVGEGFILQLIKYNMTILPQRNGLPTKIPSIVLKIFLKKQRPNIVRYQSYRHFDNKLVINDFEKIISQEYCQNQFLEFETFKRKVDFILEKHAL